MKRLRYSILFILFMGCLSAVQQSFNYKENAVYIYNFIRYTEFPEKKTAISIGVFGNSPVENELKTLLTQKKTGYTVKHIALQDIKSVDVIVVAESASKNLKEIQKGTDKLPILIITEKPDLNYSGACISLYMDEEDNYKTKFQVSPFNLRSRKLTVSQQILTNAEIVR